MKKLRCIVKVAALTSLLVLMGCAHGPVGEPVEPEAAVSEKVKAPAVKVAYFRTSQNYTKQMEFDQDIPYVEWLRENMNKGDTTLATPIFIWVHEDEDTLFVLYDDILKKGTSCDGGFYVMFADNVEACWGSVAEQQKLIPIKQQQFDERGCEVVWQILYEYIEKNVDA